MIEAQAWVSGVLPRLQEAFGTRLRYLGLQGSYRRGEATEASDIDLVVLLDKVELADLDAYRAIVRAMPEGNKACGFLCGIGELSVWPPHELFTFKEDTDDYFGKLDDCLPPINPADIRYGARVGASALLHLLTHSYLYADAETRPVILQDACKSAFFLMQPVKYLETGHYYRNKRDLLPHLKKRERDIIEAGLEFPAWLENHSEERIFEMLLDWCRDVMRSV